MSHFKHAELAKIAGAGHWLQHDRPDEVLGLIQRFLG
jgi:pimeloyl-ACP methyl ester carboxylesterase